MYVRADSLRHLQAFLPDFWYRTELNLLDQEKKVIYEGKVNKSIKYLLEDKCKDFIATGYPYQYDLRDKGQFLRFLNVYKDWFSERAIKVFTQYSDEVFLEEVKKYWVVRKGMENLTEEGSVFQFFKASNSSFREQLEEYFKLNLSRPVIESSFFTFLSRVLRYEEQEVSVPYKKLLREVYERRGKAIQKSVGQYLESGYLSDELRFVKFLMDMRVVK